LCGKMTEPELARFLMQIGSALQYLHAQHPPVVHQDIKPENILIDDQGNYLLTDFGISTRIRRTLTRSMGNRTGSSGTTAYMAPERFSENLTDREPICANDIFALGVTMFELLTDELPYGEQGGIVAAGGLKPAQLPEKFYEELRELIGRCVHNKVNERPNADELKLWAENLIVNGGIRNLQKTRKKKTIKQSRKIRNINPNTVEYLHFRLSIIDIRHMLFKTYSCFPLKRLLVSLIFSFFLSFLVVFMLQHKMPVQCGQIYDGKTIPYGAVVPYNANLTQGYTGVFNTFFGNQLESDYEYFSAYEVVTAALAEELIETGEIVYDYPISLTGKGTQIEYRHYIHRLSYPDCFKYSHRSFVYLKASLVDFKEMFLLFVLFFAIIMFYQAVFLRIKRRLNNSNNLRLMRKAKIFAREVLIEHVFFFRIGLLFIVQPIFPFPKRKSIIILSIFTIALSIPLLRWQTKEIDALFRDFSFSIRLYQQMIDNETRNNKLERENFNIEYDGGIYEMVWVPGGVSIMENDNGCSKRVYLRGFFIGKQVVNQGFWKTVMGEDSGFGICDSCENKLHSMVDEELKKKNPENSFLIWKKAEQSFTRPTGCYCDRRPVSTKGMSDINRFLYYADQGVENQLEFSLPTEAQWEYAAKKEKISWGNHQVGDFCCDYYSSTCCEWGDENFWGCYFDPMGPKRSNETKGSVVRGRDHSLSNRDYINDDYFVHDCGFRLVLNCYLDRIMQNSRNYSFLESVEKYQ
ncbi:MAG: protein kinase, partial [Bacteroidetes bacterium]|nr:protein kinase [Bacteroidota bacterium]